MKTREAILHSEKLQALWNRIKHKTTYRVKFDNEKLIANCAVALCESQTVTKTCVQIRKADLAIGRGGVQSEQTTVSAPIVIDDADIQLPDVLTDLQDKTQITWRIIVRILPVAGASMTSSATRGTSANSPRRTINPTKRLALVNGIRYQRIGDDE